MFKFMVVVGLSMPQWLATKEDPTSKEIPTKMNFAFKTTLLKNSMENKHVQEMVCRKEESSYT
jgi:hypothetical protein